MVNIQQSKKAIIILAILLIISMGYIGIDKYQESQETKLLNVYQKGYGKGIQETVVSLYQKTENCQTARIQIDNVSKQIFDTACLQIAQQ